MVVQKTNQGVFLSNHDRNKKKKIPGGKAVGKAVGKGRKGRGDERKKTK